MRRAFVVLLVISMSLIVAAAGCHPDPELPKIAEQIARDQGTDKAAVMSALEEMGGSNQSKS